MKKRMKNGVKKAPSFGILDAVIILLVIVAVVGVYFRYNIIGLITSSQGLEDYTVSFTVENIRYTTPEFVNVGDDVYFADDGKYFGTLTNVSENMGALSIIPASEYFTTQSGEVIEVHYPDEQSRVNASGRMECTGRYSENGEFLVDGKAYIACGQYVGITTEYVTVDVRIDKIAPKASE